MFAGMYLPVIAVLGGMLFVKPSGFNESRRDVIRLSPVIAEIQKQQGHITCKPLKPAAGGPAIQAPLHCSLLVRPAQVSPLSLLVLLFSNVPSLLQQSQTPPPSSPKPPRTPSTLP